MCVLYFYSLFCVLPFNSSVQRYFLLYDKFMYLTIKQIVHHNTQTKSKYKLFNNQLKNINQTKQNITGFRTHVPTDTLNPAWAKCNAQPTERCRRILWIVIVNVTLINEALPAVGFRSAKSWFQLYHDHYWMELISDSREFSWVEYYGICPLGHDASFGKEHLWEM